MKKVLVGLVFLGGGFVLVSDRFILPQIIGWDGFGVRVYGVVLAFAVYLSYFVAQKRFVALSYGREWLDGLFLYLVGFGFVFARIYHVISEFDLYRQNIVSVFYVWNGGLGIYGAVIGGILGLVLFLIRRGEFSFDKLLKVLDLLFPALLVGQIVGRFGNLFNYELYGYPTSSVFGLYVPDKFRELEFLSFERFHPLFLYEAVFNLLLLCLLLLLEKKNKLLGGSLFFLAILGYNSVRFFLEFLRIDSVLYSGFRLNAIVSLCFVLVSVLIVLYKNNAGKVS